MSRRLSCARVHLALLRGAALLVPASQRREWLAEWRSELWYVSRISSGGRAAVFCLGSFMDALWLRRHAPRAETHGRPYLESPWRCLSFLGLLAAACLWGAFRLPNARQAILPPDGNARSLVMVSHAEALPSISLGDYRSLAGRLRNQFSGIAYYRPIRAEVRMAAGRTAGLSVALAGNDLLPVLGIQALPREPAGLNAAPLLLSRAAWRKYFDRDPHIVGRTLNITARRVRIAGIVSFDAWQLPGHVDAWMIQHESEMAAMPPESKGFVIGRTLPTAAGLEVACGSRNLYCTPLARRPAILIYFVMLFVAFLILPAVTSFELGEYPLGRHPPSRATRFRRWGFLAIKILLLIVIVFCGTLDLTAISSAEFQAHGWLIGYVIAFRWALNDQRQRCPVCLRRLINPTRIGRLSATLLEWCGTELMCRRGHGLLHVPEIPASSYSRQRWLALDGSWSSFFPQPEPVSRR